MQSSSSASSSQHVALASLVNQENIAAPQQMPHPLLKSALDAEAQVLSAPQPPAHFHHTSPIKPSTAAATTTDTDLARPPRPAEADEAQQKMQMEMLAISNSDANARQLAQVAFAAAVCVALAPYSEPGASSGTETETEMLAGLGLLPEPHELHGLRSDLFFFAPEYIDKHYAHLRLREVHRLRIHSHYHSLCYCYCYAC